MPKSGLPFTVLKRIASAAPGARSGYRPELVLVVEMPDGRIVHRSRRLSMKASATREEALAIARRRVDAMERRAQP